MNGAYKLLEELVGYEQFTPDTYIYNVCENLSLPSLDYYENPDIPVVLGGYGSVYSTADRADVNRMGMLLNTQDMFIETDEVYKTHNVCDIMDFVTNKGDITKAKTWSGTTVNLSGNYPENNGLTYYGGKTTGFKVGWFSVFGYKDTDINGVDKNGNIEYGNPLKVTSNSHKALNKMVQLCYSGGTKHTASSHPVWEEMVEFGAQRVASIIINDKSGMKVLQFTAEDNTRYCQCSACLDWYTYYSQGDLDMNPTNSVFKYEGFMGLQLRFVNAMAKRVAQLLPANKQDVKIATFCYSKYTEAPCKKSGNTYVPIDDAVICPDNVLIYLAPNMDYTEDFSNTSNTTNQKMLQILDALDVICDNFGAWLYQDTYQNYFIPEDNFYAYKGIYSKLAEMGCQWIFHQGKQTNTLKSTAFCELKLYMNSVMAFDTSLDSQAVIDRFFNGYFGAASTDMKKYFNELNAHLAPISIGSTSCTAENFPKDKLKTWLGYCDAAIKDLASLKKTDSARYKLLVNNVECEKLWIEFMLIYLYSDYSFYSGPASLTEAQVYFEERCYNIGVRTPYQHNYINITDGAPDAFWKDF